MSTNVDIADSREKQARRSQAPGDNGVSEVVHFKPGSLSLSFPSLQAVTVPNIRRIKQGGPRITEDLLTRTSHVNAAVAYRQVQKVCYML